MNNKCKGITVSGEACNGSPLGGGEFCTFHAPEMAEIVQQGRYSGGRARAYPKMEGLPPIDLSDPKGYTNLLGEVIEMLRSLDSSVPQARALLTAIEAGIKVQEFTSINDRIQALETKMNKENTK